MSAAELILRFIDAQERGVVLRVGNLPGPTLLTFALFRLACALPHGVA